MKRMCGLVVAVWLGLSTPGLAADAPVAGLGPGAPAGASQRYEIAKRHYRKGEFALAAGEFKAALAMYPSAKLAFNWARSAERAGQIEDAIEAYRRYLQLAPGAKDHAEITSLIPILVERLRESYPEVAVISRPAGARIYLDGSEAPLKAPTPTTIRLKPGAHTIRLVAAGHHPLDRPVQVKEGTTGSVDAELSPVKKAAPPPPPPVVEAEPKPKGTSALTIAGWSALGLGVAGLGVGGLYTLEVNDIAADSEGKRDAERDQAKSDFESAQNLAVIGYVAGGVLVAAGVVLLLIPDADEAPVTLAPTPDGAVLTVRF